MAETRAITPDVEQKPVPDVVAPPDPKEFKVVGTNGLLYFWLEIQKKLAMRAELDAVKAEAKRYTDDSIKNAISGSY